jgi:hypothetical protein
MKSNKPRRNLATLKPLTPDFSKPEKSRNQLVQMQHDHINMLAQMNRFMLGVLEDAQAQLRFLQNAPKLKVGPTQ